MRRLVIPVGLALLCGIAAFAGVRLTAEAAPPPLGPAAPIDPNATPVLVELFTSEGCSSCPPADAVLARLSQSQPVANARVIVLAHHVDYWNQLGWPDPYSSAAATQRQRSYGGSYTPQAIIDGKSEMVGSRGPAIEQAIAARVKESTHTKIDLEVVKNGAAFDVIVKSPAVTNEADGFVAIVQDRGRVVVPKGENSGRTLDHVGIARSIRPLGAIPKTGGTALRTTLSVPNAISAPPNGGTSFSVVAFVQERTSHHVLGVATQPLQ